LRHASTEAEVDGTFTTFLQKQAAALLIGTDAPRCRSPIFSPAGLPPACGGSSLAPCGGGRSQRKTEIAIRFKQAPYAAFQGTPVETLRPNWLVLRIAPDEGVSLQFEVKRRGPVVDLAAVKMDFHYDDWFPKEPNVGYETLIYDVMIGDPTLFMRADMVEQSWRIVQPVLDAWAFSPIDFSAIVRADNVERVLTDIDARLRQSQSVLSQAWRAPCLGAPGQLIAGEAGARPDHPISGPCARIGGG
jgi:hypothetical protein